MELETEIGQSAFDNQHHKLIVNILFTQSWLVSQMKGFLQQFGLTVQQFNILRILREQSPHPTTLNLVRNRMLDKNSDASRIVERLRQKGMVERNQSEQDRRTVAIVITGKGREVLAQIDQQDDFFYSLTQNLSDTEAQQVNELLDTMRGSGTSEGRSAY
ncbi:MAG: MarR family transcriptional regulator [Bacteroidetes bacterium SW_11_45_7]|nr:MAG: MarR family transcriptional regulator [Bacteroidetes bacterium SW_11_45_7]